MMYGFRIFLLGSSDDEVVVAAAAEKEARPGRAIPVGSKKKPSGGFGFTDTMCCALARSLCAKPYLYSTLFILQFDTSILRKREKNKR